MDPWTDGGQRQARCSDRGWREVIFAYLSSNCGETCCTPDAMHRPSSYCPFISLVALCKMWGQRAQEQVAAPESDA